MTGTEVRWCSIAAGYKSGVESTSFDTELQLQLRPRLRLLQGTEAGTGVRPETGELWGGRLRRGGVGQTDDDIMGRVKYKADS